MSQGKVKDSTPIEVQEVLSVWHSKKLFKQQKGDQAAENREPSEKTSVSEGELEMATCLSLSLAQACTLS